MAVTLHDVALRAGVSIKTVSNVVNGYAHVSAATRSRVERAVAELGYLPNLSARSMRGGRSGIIALAVPELGVPYFAELAQSVIRAADREGFIVLVDQTEGRLDRERLVCQGIRSQLIDGLIFSPLALGGEELRRRTDDIPMVLLGERVAGIFDHVVIDNVAAARQAVQHLTGLGRTRIAAVGEQHSTTGETARLRMTGYQAGLADARLPFRPELVAEAASFHRHDGAAAMARLLDSGAAPDAVFAFNDLTAIGVLRTCYDRGLRVPEDVAVIGFDDLEEGRYTVPALSTISPDKDFIGRTAVRVLAQRLHHNDAATRDDTGNGTRGDPGAPPVPGPGALPVQEIIAPHRLEARESTMGRGKR
ncbi:MAG TPA: LacI family DNA-binding transcriptional regulator [Trebonia sp.]|jgi:DNA-binding LacI/PurR family transcriptional regulator|nr:LacI family DNA-binding transcriptional regulator [Trebonia sp.]